MYYLWLLAQHKGRAETKWPADSEMFLPSGPLKREAVRLELLPLSGLSTGACLTCRFLCFTQVFNLMGFLKISTPGDSSVIPEQLLEKPLSKGQEGGQILAYKRGSQGPVGSSFGNFSGCGGPGCLTCRMLPLTRVASAVRQERGVY